jgi:hypothetical protein
VGEGTEAGEEKERGEGGEWMEEEKRSGDRWESGKGVTDKNAMGRRKKVEKDKR